MHIARHLAPTLALAALLLPGHFATAQDSRRSLDIGVNNTGISIGDSREWTGIRLNFRDTRLERASGINITVWSPTDDGAGDINGLAVGLLATGGRAVRGLGVAPLGIGVKEEMRGIAIGGLGLGAGGNISGIVAGGLGVGAGGSITGVVLGGLGAGVGGSMRGLVIGGLGAGVGGDFSGIAVGGLGIGAGGNGRGILIGGLGAGVSGSFRGLAIGGIGVGTGGDAQGVFIGGIGVGSGGTLKYVSIGGVGVGAPRVHGLAVGGAGVGGQHLTGIMIAGAMVRTDDNGTVRGATVSAFNRIRGQHNGLALGIVNYAWSLRGVQLGVINIVRDNPRGRRVLPIVNWGSGG